MCKFFKKLTILILTAFPFFITPLFSSSIADNAKKAMKEYAAYPELKERGFNLEMLDNIQSAEDLYNVLLPFMVVDGVPLDNYISFNGFKFNYHKTVYFTDDYGTITELMAKGYKPEQLFYYPSAGEEKYRAGNYVWEPAQDISSI